jgi:hypothetical protein
MAADEPKLPATPTESMGKPSTIEAVFETTIRPENLELWTSPQPSGIRVIDAIGWAHAVLERYEGAGAPRAPTLARWTAWLLFTL